MQCFAGRGWPGAGGIVFDLPDGGGDLGVAGLADEPYREVTERGHDAGAGGGPDPGRIFTVCNVTDVLSGCKTDIKGVIAKRAGRSEGQTSPTAASGVAYVARPSSAGL